MITPQLIGDLGTTEILIILAVIVLLFGAKKLPDLARGSGQALRIFKAETKELKDGDKNKDEQSGTGTARDGETVVRAEQVDTTDDQHRSDA